MQKQITNDSRSDDFRLSHVSLKNYTSIDKLVNELLNQIMEMNQYNWKHAANGKKALFQTNTTKNKIYTLFINANIIHNTSWLAL